MFAFAVAVLLAVIPAPGLRALEALGFSTPGADRDLRDALKAASLLFAARRDRVSDPQDLLAAAQADYARLLAALYAEGHYSGVISILIDGREAAGIEPLDGPEAIRRIEVSIDPGPRFTFRSARMRPYAPGTEIPPRYGDTKPARATAIAEAAAAGVAGWRAIGHATARVSDERVTADHATNEVDAFIGLDPGPRVRFGRLTISGQERMRLERIAAIAGFPSGEVFDPEVLARTAERLRRAGVFRAVTLTEAERANPDGTLDVALVLEEEAPRRFGFGAEIASLDGLTLTGFWLHRNLFGGAERLRLDGEIAGIGGDTGGEDYSFAFRVDRPATFTPDTSVFATATASQLAEPDFDQSEFTLGAGLAHEFSPELRLEVSLLYSDARVTDAAGPARYRQLSLPSSVTWDRRNSRTDATRGFYLAATAEPFLGFGTTGSGARVTADARYYRSLAAEDRVVLAARVQGGTIAGASLAATPRDYLFYTGGGGTVRGQTYQSLGVSVLSGGTVETGGLSFLAFSAEARVDVGKRGGAVAFFDAGYVDAGALWSGPGGWHSGAGFGLRYDTGIGPIRIDLGFPVGGGTGDGAQLYVGLGQAF